jgi:hypothetical protein
MGFRARLSAVLDCGAWFVVQGKTVEDENKARFKIICRVPECGREFASMEAKLGCLNCRSLPV